MLMPVGNPVAVQVYGRNPPLAVAVTGVYAVFKDAAGSVVGEATVSTPLMASENVLLVVVKVASVTDATTLKGLPVVVVGVPLIVLPLLERPAGNPVIDHE